MHRVDRKIADKYMAATSGPRRESVLKKHMKLRKAVIGYSVAGFVFAGLYASAVLYGTTFQSFWAADALFITLMFTSSVTDLCLIEWFVLLLFTDFYHLLLNF